jgi:hypothetical protein
MTLVSRAITLEVLVGATVGAAPTVHLDGVVSVKWSNGFDIRTAQAEIECTDLGGGIDFWTQVELWVGAPTPARRFSGFVYEFKYGLHPKTVTLVCRGRLILLENVPPALDAPAPTDPNVLAGLPLWGLTDAAQVRYVLNACGLTGQYVSADIGGTAAVLGVDAPTPPAPAPAGGAAAAPVVTPQKGTQGASSQFVWKYHQTGAAYVQALEAVCLGFRLFERVGGQIVRVQISPRPSAATITGDKLFVEGVDIERGTSAHSTAEARNRVRVTGLDNGTGKTAAVASAGHPHPIPGLTYVSDDFASNLIERSEPGDPGSGLTCRQVAQWRLAELNHVQLSVDFTTPRDPVISPGDTIAVSASQRLDVAQNFWVLHVDGEVSAAGFSQTFKCRAPAAQGAGGTPYGVGGIGF